MEGSGWDGDLMEMRRSKPIELLPPIPPDLLD